MNTSTRLVLPLIVSISFCHASTITDSYASGDTLTAEKLTTLKNAINDNQSQITDHQADSDSHHAQYTDAEAVSAINTAGVTLATPASSYLQITAADFVGSGSFVNAPFVIGRDWINGIFKLAAETNAAYAAAHIRHNSEITAFHCYLTDMTGLGDPTVSLYRKPWTSNDQELIATIITDGASDVSATEYSGTIDSAFSSVDTENYMYYVYADFGNVDGTDIMVHRCRVTYSYSTI